MKTRFIFLATMLFHQLATAQQSVGIGTSTPDASAALDISNNKKGLLVPRIYLTSAVDKTTVPAPAPTLLIYNTNAALPKGAGFYFNANTPASPSWQYMGELKLPFYQATSTPSSAFQIENYQQSVGSVAIKALNPVGYALETNGRLKLAGSNMTPAAGKVLTSDANGNATWEGAVAFAANGVKGGGSEVMGYAKDYKIPFATEEYDVSGNYNNAAVSPHSTFIAPVHGIYHFDVMTQWTLTSDGGGATLTLVKLSGSSVINIRSTSDRFPSDGLLSQSISSDVELNAGDQVYALIRQNSKDYLALSTTKDYCRFTGRLCIKL